MTNEEKTKEILEEVCKDRIGNIVIPDKPWTQCELTCNEVRMIINAAALMMADYKDNIFKQEILKLINRIENVESPDAFLTIQTLQELD